MILFVGEKRSNKAIEMGATWQSAQQTENGILCAKTLFHALRKASIEPRECHFANWFEDEAQRETIRNSTMPIVAMGNKVQHALKQEGISFIPIVHPAARGAIRKTENYVNHIKEQLCKLNS